LAQRRPKPFKYNDDKVSTKSGTALALQKTNSNSNKLNITHEPSCELIEGVTGMKLVVAYIQPERLNAVKQALYEREVYKMSVTNALGCGQQKGYHETYRGADIEVNLLKKIRLEVAVNEEFVEPTVEGIIAGARTGKIGDGKIFIQDLSECIRIRTGETGNEAIG
jgi:nitrogen regulatory protein P-II 1